MDDTAASGTRTTRSFCRICTSVCGILVETDGDEVVRVRGDRDHPLSRGYTCPKGRSLPQMHHHPNRIERPLLKVDGELRPTSWDACLDDLGTRLRDIIDLHGPQAVGVFFGSGIGMDAAGYRMAQRLHAAIGTPAKFSPLTIDGTAKALISDLMGGSPALSGRPDYDNATFVLFVGSNPVVSHGHTVAMPNPTGTLRALRERAEVWVIDPRHTETARLASRHLAARPGADCAILAYLVREILRDGADREVIARSTQDSAVLAAAVEPFTLERAAHTADVSPDDLRDLLDGVRRAGRLAVETGTGVTMAASANVTQWLGWALMAITGSLNQPGGAWFHPGFGHQLEKAVLPISPADGSFGPGPRSRPETQAFLGEWPCAVLADEINAGNIRAVLNLGGHLVTAFPDTERLVPALRDLELFATIEIIENETTALSTHVLPTKDQLERADLTLWDALLPRVAAQHTPAAVEPVGDRRSVWWVLAEIGRRLGHQLADTTSAEVTDETMLARITARARRPFADIAAEHWIEVPHEVPAPWVDAHVERMGGWRLAPRLLVDQLAALEPVESLVFTPRRQKRRLNSQLDHLGAVPEILLHPDDAAGAGVADSQPVTVRSASGAITGTARLDATLRRGVVSVPHGHQSANVNRLTCKDDLDLVTGMVRYGGIPVSIHPA
ncbi:molybdopterin-dependent oxidoreductase [Frankia sp. AgB1.9]|uniref:molybdopterin-containing oxidoreductase family protein n=1 Tax=unclassified Frankia TaxID=2632575 RepID=UPI0019335499|nr:MULTISPECIES: molybdopterin-dependent oxidoreductase [unclassified Frankia]MBL7486864.1 molybdopterin-dependent oxidoreductase [Frankia sp. AgW1.1]MBL7547249.1 molybdopterin-dependent oxidoreductase [Frankia sp. AgB1.9]MBL7621504.1 molybdopterin-dependent oxidoreductase [Frankia sp. AgB1.8]